MEGLDDVSLMKERLEEAELRIHTLEGVVRALFALQSDDDKTTVMRIARTNSVTEVAGRFDRPKAEEWFRKFFPAWSSRSPGGVG